MPEPKVGEGEPGVGEPLEKDGRHPETVSWTQYVGIKEKFNKVESDLKGKVANLEEQLKSAPNPVEFKKTKDELDLIKAEHQKVSDELKTTKEKSLSEKREFLKSKGIPEDEVKAMSEEALTGAVRVLERIKPKPDLGGGGGSGSLKGSPMELARQAYSKK